MTTIVSDFSRVDDAWRENVSGSLLKPRRESSHIMNIRLDGVGALANLFKVFPVVSETTYLLLTMFLFQIIILPVFSGLGFRWSPIIWSDYTISHKIMSIIWYDYMGSFGDSVSIFLSI